MKFELSEKERISKKEVLKKIKKKYGTYGHITYMFTPTGIGDVVKMKSSHSEKEYDITDISSW